MLNPLIMAIAGSAILISAPLWAGGGSEVGNGAGIAEQNFVFAYSQLGATTRLCLDAQVCQLTDGERSLLSRIHESLNAEGVSGSQLRFKSERQEPGFFILDGQLKIARTGSAVGSAIYVNIDLLYQKGPDGEFESLNVETATAILVHELGHHQGEADHAALDRLGVKVGLLIGSRISRTDLGPGRRHLRISVIDIDRRDSMARIMVADGFKSVDLSPVVWQAVHCSSGLLEGAALFNPQGRLQEDRLKVRADLTLFCSGREESGYQVEASVQVFVDSQGKPRLFPGSESAEQVECKECGIKGELR